MLALMLATLSMSAPPRFSRRQIALAAVTGVGTAASPRAVHAMEPDVPLDPAQLEPEAARKLLALVEGRRPSEWRCASRVDSHIYPRSGRPRLTPSCHSHCACLVRVSLRSEEEKAEVDALIEEVVKLRAPWPRGGLRGKWQLAYLQPGPDGTGVDRRIPFPELPGNDSFQIFGADSVTNVGELLGRSLEVRVSGSLSEEDERVLSSPKRFRADINRGQLCAGAAADAACLPLPIKGVGLFDGVYLDRRCAALEPRSRHDALRSESHA